MKISNVTGFKLWQFWQPSKNNYELFLEFGDEFNDNAYTDNLTHFRGRGHNNVYDDIN